MFYRVMTILNFVTEDDANDFYNNGEDALEKAITINPGQEYAEISHIILHKCYHDTQPGRECEKIKEDQTPA